MIVVGVILILAAIAIPKLLRSRILANEASAITSARTITSAEQMFAATYKSGFTDTLRRLAGPSSGAPDINSADLLDPILAASSSGNLGATGFVKSGYAFVYTPQSGSVFGAISQYQMTINPQIRGNTGDRGFFTDQTGVVRANSTATATASDNPI